MHWNRQQGTGSGSTQNQSTLELCLLVVATTVEAARASKWYLLLQLRQVRQLLLLEPQVQSRPCSPPDPLLSSFDPSLHPKPDPPFWARTQKFLCSWLYSAGRLKAGWL